MTSDANAEIVTRTEVIYLDPDGFLFSKIKANAYLEIEDGIESFEASRALTEGRKTPILIDIREMKGISRECRQYFAGEDVAQERSAAAMIIGSSLTQIIGNFFIGLNKTKFPTRLFTDEEKARKWILEFVEN